MDATNESSTEAMAAIVRRIVARELSELDIKLALSDDDVDRLAKLALVLQRIRQPASKPGDDADGNLAEKASHESLMRKAG